MYNAADAIRDNIASLRSQSHTDFRCILIDDMSTDDTVQRIRQAIQGDERFTLVVNTEKKYKTRNVVEGIALARAADEDVIVLVDGDDRLAGDDALATVCETYRQHDCWMTYGSFLGPDGKLDPYCVAYDSAIIRRNSYRRHRWLGSHLKTFKYKLWKRLDMDIFHVSEQEHRAALRRALFSLRLRAWREYRKLQPADLMDASGRYIRRVDDKAFSYPMLEMSGHRACFIGKPLYCFYSQRQDGILDQNYGADKSEKWATRLIRDIVEHKRPYPRLQQL